MIMGIHSDDLLIFILTFGVLVLLAFVFSQMARDARMKKRIARLQQRKAARSKPIVEDALQLRRKGGERISPLIAYLMKPLPNIESLGNRLSRAGYTIGARQYLFRCVLVMLTIMFAVVVAGRPVWWGLGAGSVIGIVLPLRLLNGKITRTKKKFLTLFPDGIDLIVRGLRSGLPVADSISLVAREVPAPVGSTFAYVTNTVKLGVPLEKALQEVARKLDYTEFNFFVTSIILQRETGGNLGEILNNLGDVLRKRIMLQLKIKAMTSEARVSSYIIGALPFIVIGAVTVLSPSYLHVLYTDPRGEHALCWAAGMLISGLWVMRRLGKFEI
jgi:tight adherence protein B